MSDAHYIERTLNGDHEAFRSLVQKYQNMVFTVALRVVKNREEAEEIAQDAFLKAFQKLDGFKGGSKFSTWLYTIVYNTAISRTRKKKHEVQDIEDLGNSEELATSNMEQLNAMKQDEQTKYLTLALERLASDDAAIVTLYYLEERSIEEVSDITRLTKSNVKVKLHRSRQRLQFELEDLLKSELSSLIR